MAERVGQQTALEKVKYMVQAVYTDLHVGHAVEVQSLSVTHDQIVGHLYMISLNTTCIDGGSVCVCGWGVLFDS